MRMDCKCNAYTLLHLKAHAQLSHVPLHHTFPKQWWESVSFFFFCAIVLLLTAHLSINDQWIFQRGVADHAVCPSHPLSPSASHVVNTVCTMCVMCVRPWWLSLWILDYFQNPSAGSKICCLRCKVTHCSQYWCVAHTGCSCFLALAKS